MFHSIVIHSDNLGANFQWFCLYEDYLTMFQS